MSRQKKKHGVFYFLFGILAAVILTVEGSLAGVCFYALIDQAKPADCIIVLGAAAYESGVSPVYRERINHAIRLYDEGYADTIIMAGGYGAGNSRSDAHIGMEYAVSQGVPEEDILLEEKSTVTEENLLFSKEIMEENGLETAILVSDPPHMRRAMLQAKHVGLQALSSPTKTSMYKGIPKVRFIVRETFYMIGYRLLYLID